MLQGKFFKKGYAVRMSRELKDRKDERNRRKTGMKRNK